MAIICLEGFDGANTSPLMEAKPYISDVTVSGIGSSYARFSPGNGVYLNGIGHRVEWSFSEANTIWCGHAMRLNSVPSFSSSYPWIMVYNDDGEQLRLFVTSGGEVAAYRYTTLLGTSSNSNLFPIGSWVYVEFYAKIDNSAGEVKVKINEVEELNLTSQDTQYQTSSGVSKVAIQRVYASSQYIDDLYLNDSEFMGDIKVVTKFPNANGTYSQFTPSAGSNYENVDETPPDDDTTYNQANAVGQKDSFTISATGLDGTIKGVQLSNYAKKTGTKITGVKNLVRVGGSDYLGSEKFLYSNYAYHSSVWENNPNTSNPWTAAQVVGAEYGVEVTSLSTTTTT